MSREAMQMALEALEWNHNTDLDNIPACEQWAKMLNETITALRAALLADVTPAQMAHADAVAEPEKNPFGDDAERYARKLHEEREYYKALFTERKPLTDEEIDRITDQQWGQDNHKPIYAAHRAYARAVIAAYEAKQGGQT